MLAQLRLGANATGRNEINLSDREPPRPDSLTTVHTSSIRTPDDCEAEVSPAALACAE